MIECLVPPRFYIRTRPLRAVCPARSAPVNPGPPSAEKTKDDNAPRPLQRPCRLRPTETQLNRTGDAATASCPLPRPGAPLAPTSPGLQHRWRALLRSIIGAGVSEDLCRHERKRR